MGRETLTLKADLSPGRQALILELKRQSCYYKAIFGNNLEIKL